MVYKAGCWSFIFVGIGHVVASKSVPSTPERIEIVQEMKEFSISMLGTESNLYLFHEGFSLMMGILLIGYGFLNLAFMKECIIPGKQIIIINIAVSLITFVVSVKYFFIVPVVVLCIAFLCFFMALILSAKLVNYS